MPSEKFPVFGPAALPPTDIPWAHLYAQGGWHDEAYLVGNRAALVALRDALDAALRTGVGAAELYANDGEGYVALCLLRPSLEGMATPYTDAERGACDPLSSTAVQPSDIEPDSQRVRVAINAAHAREVARIGPPASPDCGQ